MKRVLGVFMVLVLLIVAGCGSGQKPSQPSQTTQPSTSTPAPAKQEPINIVYPQTNEPKTLSPGFAADTGNYMPTSNIYSHLVTMDWGVTKGVGAYGDLAQSWTVSPDAKTYTFKLHSNVKWHDGKPLTSADVKYTFDTMIAKKYPYSAYLKDVKQITASDETTLVVELNNPDVSFVPMMAQAAGWTGKIYPKHIWEGTDGWDKGDYVNKPVGSGPFKFKEWVKGSHITMEANPDYFKGKPKVDGLIIRFLPDPNVARAEYEAGKITALPYDYSPPWAEIPALEKLPDTTLVFTPSHYSRDIQLNLKKAPLNDLKVRTALAHAIDRQGMSQQAFAGKWKPAEHASVDGAGDWINRNVKFPAFDKAKAEALLDEAGYKKGADGWRFPLSVTGPAFADCRAMMEVLVQQLRSVGINAKYENYDQSTWFTKAQKGEFDVSCYFTRYGPDPDAYIEHFGTGGARNFMGYSNPELDRIGKEAKAMTDKAGRKQRYDRIQEMLVRDLPYINLLNEFKLSLVRKGWDGFSIQEKGFNTSVSWFGVYGVTPPGR